MSKLRTDQLVSVDQTATLDVKDAVAKLAVAVDEIIAGAGIAVDSTDPTKPVISASGDSGMSNPMTTAGDMITGGTSGSPQRIAVGSDGQVLKVVAGAPAWADESGGASSGPSFAPWGTAAGLDLLDSNTLAGKNVSISQIQLARSAKFKGGGKWYVEFEVVNIGPISTNLSIGMASPDTPLSFTGIDGAGANYIFFRGNGQVFRNGGYLGSAGAIFGNGDVVGFAFDGTTSGVVDIYKNGGLLMHVTSSPGPFAPCVVFEAYSGIAVRMLSAPTYSIPAGHTYWD